MIAVGTATSLLPPLPVSLLPDVPAVVEPAASASKRVRTHAKKEEEEEEDKEAAVVAAAPPDDPPPAAAPPTDAAGPPPPAVEEEADVLVIESSTSDGADDDEATAARLTGKQLRELLRSNGISAGGSKVQMVRRLREHKVHLPTSEEAELVADAAEE